MTQVAFREQPLTKRLNVAVWLVTPQQLVA